MQYLPNTKIPCIEYDELVLPKGIIPKGTYDSLKHRGNIRVSCTGGNGRVILIEYPSLPKKYRDMVVARYGEPEQYIAMQPLKGLAEYDDMARQYYASYQLPNGDHLPIDYQLKYARQCYWFKALDKAMNDKRTTKDTLNISIDQLWSNFSLLINNDDEVHDLPTSVDRLKRRYRIYRDTGYGGLVEAWRFGNNYARKVTPKIEGLILSLYYRLEKPYMHTVCKDYKRFMAGKEIVVDINSGEVYDPKDFYISAPKSKGGKDERIPYALAESTVDYYLKKPYNQALGDKIRMKALDYNTKHRPSVHRLAPFYAFSKITMDDLDIPFKTPEGDRAVKSYQIFDVASGAVVGVSFSRDKNVELIREAIRGMFRLIIRNGWGVPYEIEFEKHLTSAMTGGVDEDGSLYEDILTPGAVFPATRMCKGGNAKEKHAETFIRVKKYGQQKKRPGFQARHYARLLTNRLNADQDKMRYEYEEIVQNELEDIAAHNNELHPRQDLYPNMTRWQVLTENQNPKLGKFQAHQVIQYIGYETHTSIRAGKVQVQGAHYMLPDINLITKQHYNGKITAYYLPDDKGEITSVYLYEDGKYLCEAHKKRQFQEAIIEQTDTDKEIMAKQFGQQAAFDKMVRDNGLVSEHRGETRGKIAKVGIAKALPPAREAVEVGVEPANTPHNTSENAGYGGGYYQNDEDAMYISDSEDTAISRANSMF